MAAAPSSQANGKNLMSAIQRRVALMALVILPIPGWTGNLALMEQNARELIGVNQAILEALNMGIQEGEYRLSTRVTTGPGQPLFQVDHVEVVGPSRATGSGPAATLSPMPWVPSPAPDAKGAPDGPDVLAPFGQASPSLRFGPIPDQVELAAARSVPVTPLTAGQTDQRAPASLDPLTFSTAPSQPGPHHPSPKDATHPLPLDSPTTGGAAVLKPW